MYRALCFAAVVFAAVASPVALTAYQAACVRLQFLANWMSVLLKLKSAWAITTTHAVRATTQPTTGVFRPERPEAGECGRSLQVTLQMFIHYQSQLLRLKAALGNAALRSGKTQLQERIEKLDILNKTSSEIFDKLMQSSQYFITAENFTTNFQNQRNLNTNSQEEEDLDRTRLLLKMVIFLQNLGNNLDKIISGSRN